MNAEIIFTEFAKYAESDSIYYTFGKHGIIEDVLAWFNIPSKKFVGSSSCVHADNLDRLHDFMINNATNDQLMMIANIYRNHANVPVVDSIDDTAGQVFVSMPMNEQNCDCVATIRDGIRTALKITGNEPYFLDKDFHSENIYNVMLEHIHNCKFLVADLTTQNLGVYYEAGYAKALGKTVIFTCKDTDNCLRKKTVILHGRITVFFYVHDSYCLFIYSCFAASRACTCSFSKFKVRYCHAALCVSKRDYVRQHLFGFLRIRHHMLHAVF